MGQGRWSRERAGNYRIPLCQALFGACSKYSAPLLGALYVNCAYELLSMTDRKFCSLFCKVGHCQSQDSKLYPANNQAKVLSVTVSTEEPGFT